MQTDMFEHHVNARLVELKKAIQDRAGEIEQMREEIRNITATLKGRPLDLAGTTTLVQGTLRTRLCKSNGGK